MEAAHLVLGELRVLNRQRAECVDEDFCNFEPHKWFVICGDSVPGSPGCGCLTEGFFVGSHVGVPVPAFADITHGELPVLGGVFDAREEALFLFFLGDIEPEFEDCGVVACQMKFMIADGLVAIFEQVIDVARFDVDILAVQVLGVYAHDEDFFVV